MNGNETTPQGEYRTSDLYFAAYLQVADVPMSRHERDHKGKVTFIFDSSFANMTELKRAWFNRQGKVAALPFADNIKSLKSICHMA